MLIDPSFKKFYDNWASLMTPHEPQYFAVFLVQRDKRRPCDKSLTVSVRGFTKCYWSGPSEMTYGAESTLLSERTFASQRLANREIVKLRDEFFVNQHNVGTFDIMPIYVNASSFDETPQANTVPMTLVST